MEESSDNEQADNFNSSAKRTKKAKAGAKSLAGEGVGRKSCESIRTNKQPHKKNKVDDADKKSGQTIYSLESSKPRKKQQTSKKNKKTRVLFDTESVFGHVISDSEGLAAIFLTSKTQERFGLVIDDDVTAEDTQRFILKADIMADLAEFPDSSDFIAIKHLIMDYTEEELLIVYDPEFTMGQNFYTAITEMAKMRISTKTAPTSEEDAEDAGVLPYLPPIAMPWDSLGSEVEIEDWTIVANRNMIKVSLKRDSSHFLTETSFSHFTAEDNTQALVDIHSVEDKLYSDVKRVEIDVGVQAIPVVCERGVQKIQGLNKNAIVQCVPRQMDEKEAEEVMQSSQVAAFLNKIMPIMEKSLQQNQIMDVFHDDWRQLNVGEEAIFTKSDNHLKEFQSYTDMQYCKAHCVSHIAWHPTLPDLAAVALIENGTFYDHMDSLKKQTPHPSLILIWNFADPIHPLLKLEAPAQILCFQFCPTNPNFIAGGCFSGQLVLWDLSCFKEQLKNAPSGKKKQMFNLPSDLDTSKMMQVGRFCAVSSIENSHKAPVSHLVWMPHQYEITKYGSMMANHYEQSFQLLSSSVDQSLMFWDIRTFKGTIPGDAKKEVCLSPPTFKHLNLLWKAFLKVSMVKEETGVDHVPVKFLVHTDVAKGTENTEVSTQSMLFIGTEDGDVLYMNWCPMKDQDSGKYQAQKPIFSHNVHNGPIVALEKSPFLSDIVLSAGGWNFALWKEGVNDGPIFTSASCPKHYTGACWSASRACVLFLAKQDGSVDVWDLLDRTHEPIHTQTISTTQITQISSIILHKHFHLLALGDANGTLHLLELPPSLTVANSNELANMHEYLATEGRRMVYLRDRREKRLQAVVLTVAPKKVGQKEGKKEEKVEEEEEEESNGALYANFLQLEDLFKQQLQSA